MTTLVHRPARRLLYAAAVLGAAGSAAACGSSSPGTSASASHSASSGSSSGMSSTSPATIGAKNVPGFGTVLVNGQDRTLYLLTSEKGGKVTCTSANGCAKFWPPVELPKGTTAATAGSGVTASLLGTAKAPGGSRYVTYHGWPLYTYAGDSAPGQAHGEGIVSFGGTWYVLNVSGNPVTGKHPAPSSSSSSSGSGGYGY